MLYVMKMAFRQKCRFFGVSKTKCIKTKENLLKHKSSVTKQKTPRTPH